MKRVLMWESLNGNRYASKEDCELEDSIFLLSEAHFDASQSLEYIIAKNYDKIKEIMERPVNDGEILDMVVDRAESLNW